MFIIKKVISNYLIKIVVMEKDQEVWIDINHLVKSNKLCKKIRTKIVIVDSKLERRITIITI